MQQTPPETATETSNLGDSFEAFSAHVAQSTELLLSNEALLNDFFEALETLNDRLKTCVELETSHLEEEARDRSRVESISDSLAARIQTVINRGGRVRPLFSPTNTTFPPPEFPAREPSILVTNAAELSKLIELCLKRFQEHPHQETQETDLLNLQKHLADLPRESPLHTLVNLHLLPALEAITQSLKP